MLGRNFRNADKMHTAPNIILRRDISASHKDRYLMSARGKARGKFLHMPIHPPIPIEGNRLLTNHCYLHTGSVYHIPNTLCRMRNTLTPQPPVEVLARPIHNEFPRSAYLLKFALSFQLLQISLGSSIRHFQRLLHIIIDNLPFLSRHRHHLFQILPARPNLLGIDQYIPELVEGLLRPFLMTTRIMIKPSMMPSNKIISWSIEFFKIDFCIIPQKAPLDAFCFPAVFARRLRRPHYPDNPSHAHRHSERIGRTLH